MIMEQGETDITQKKLHEDSCIMINKNYLIIGYEKTEVLKQWIIYIQIFMKHLENGPKYIKKKNKTT